MEKFCCTENDIIERHGSKTALSTYCGGTEAIKMERDGKWTETDFSKDAPHGKWLLLRSLHHPCLSRSVLGLQNRGWSTLFPRHVLLKSITAFRQIKKPLPMGAESNRYILLSVSTNRPNKLCCLRRKLINFTGIWGKMWSKVWCFFSATFAENYSCVYPIHGSCLPADPSNPMHRSVNLWRNHTARSCNCQKS